MAFEDRLAQNDLAMAFLERGIDGRGGVVSARNGPIERPETLLERVGKSFVVAAGVVQEGSGCVGKQCRIPNKRLVRLVAVPDPQFVGRFAVEGHGALRTGDFPSQTVLPPGGDLGDVKTASGTAFEAEQHGAVIFRGDRHGFRLASVGRRR